MDLLHHLAVQAAVRLVNARGVDEYDLPRRPPALRLHVQKALHVHGRGLRLLRHDGNLLAHQGVDQRTLPRVGPAHNGNKARPVCHYALTCLGGEPAFSGCARHTRTFSTLRSVDSRISNLRPSSSTTSPGCGMRPAIALTSPPTVAVSCSSSRTSKRSRSLPTSTVPCITDRKST